MLKQGIIKRKKLRLSDYDYSQEWWYFVTICTQNRECLFGKVENWKMVLNEIGKMAKECWQKIPNHFKNINLDVFVIMPNHIHGIIVIEEKINVGVGHAQPLQNKFQHVLPSSLNSIILSYKSAVSKMIHEKIYKNFSWQRNFYENVIRNEKSLSGIQNYILNNPLKWEYDKENPDNKLTGFQKNNYYKF